MSLRWVAVCCQEGCANAARHCKNRMLLKADMYVWRAMTANTPVVSRLTQTWQAKARVWTCMEAILGSAGFGWQHFERRQADHHVRPLLLTHLTAATAAARYRQAGGRHRGPVIEERASESSAQVIRFATSATLHTASHAGSSEQLDMLDRVLSLFEVHLQHFWFVCR